MCKHANANMNALFVSSRVKTEVLYFDVHPSVTDYQNEKMYSWA